jgi:hypothetical protein
MKNHINTFYSILLVSVILLVSCSGEQSNDFVFSNDLENVRGWAGAQNNEHTVRKGEAHSGKYLSKTDSVYQYGFTYRIFLSQVSSDPINKLKASTWVKINDEKANADLVIALDSVGKSISWSSIPISEFVRKTDEWKNVTYEVQWPELKSSKDYMVTVFIWNRGRADVFADDIRVEFLK